MSKEIDLGTCCACGEKRPFTRNLMCLDFEAPIPGTGWGCVKCELPLNGAMAVLCDECLNANATAEFVVVGLAMERRRVAIDDVEKRPFLHDLSKHPELELASNHE